MEDGVPLTPVVVDCVAFDKAPLGRRGYNEDQVDEFLDRVQATLAGTDNLTAQEVREVVFDAAPFIRRGYHEDQVDDFLDVVVTELDNRERNRSASVGAAQRQRTPRPAARSATPPADASEQTSPVLPKLPAEQAAPALPPASHRATPSGASYPAPANPPAAAAGYSYPPAPVPSPSYPAATASSPSFPPASGARGSNSSGSHAASSPASAEPPPTPGRGPLALPLPPTPPTERGYHPADVARLVALLTEPTEPPSSAAITGIRMNRMDVGQGYHAGAVDAMRAIWITELRRRNL